MGNMKRVVGVSRVLLTATFFACLCVVGENARAQTFPSKPVKIIVPYPAGGGTDVAARLIAQKLSERWGQPVVVENRSGAAGTVGAAAVAKAAPDGYTLLLVANAYAVTATLYRALPYDALKDLTPITLVASYPFVLCVNPSISVRSIGEFVSLAKAKPKQLTFASAGIGSGGHLSMELLKVATAIDLLHVPYRGSTPALADVMSGEVNSIFEPLSGPLLPLIEAGKLRPLAVSTPKRSPLLPNVPTVSEALNIKEFDVTSWFGLLAPAGTTPEIIKQINGEVVTILAADETKGRFHGIGAEPWSSTPDEFGSFLRREIDKWTKLIKTIGLEDPGLPK
jgi:tripartite-type tricarboxylate transporter receptor subunit TctC